MDTSVPPSFLTAAEVADRWRVDRRTVTRMAELGRLPAVRFGAGDGVIRFRLEDIEAREQPRKAA